MEIAPLVSDPFMPRPIISGKNANYSYSCNLRVFSSYMQPGVPGALEYVGALARSQQRFPSGLANTLPRLVLLTACVHSAPMCSLAILGMDHNPLAALACQGPCSNRQLAVACI